MESVLMLELKFLYEDKEEIRDPIDGRRLIGDLQRNIHFYWLEEARDGTNRKCMLFFP